MQSRRTLSTPEISGSLEGVGVPAIVRFLAGLKKTGCLRISVADWGGEVWFREGAVVTAIFGSCTGLSALDALAQLGGFGTFSFDTTATLNGVRTIDLAPRELQAHLDHVVAAASDGRAGLPALAAVPVVVHQDEPANEEQVPLDRGTLQTLLAIDGQRSVRDILHERGSLEALWQVSSLIDVGLVQFAAAPAPPPAPPAAQPAPPVQPAPPPAPAAPPPAQPAPPAAQPAAARHTRPPYPAEPVAPPPETRPHPSEPVVAPTVVAPLVSHCLKLGFEDDPASSYARPTRLHRCFAADTPLAVSLDQQRELCLTDQFAVCPRLAAKLRAQRAQPAAGTNGHADPRPRPNDPRLAAAARGLTHDPPAPIQPEPRFQAGDFGHADHVDQGGPLALGARLRLVLPAAITATVALVAIVLLLAPNLDSFGLGDGVDPKQLPNASAVVAGTPVSQLPIVRPTATPASDPAARDSTGAAATADTTADTAAEPTAAAASAPALPPRTTGARAAEPTAAASSPTVATSASGRILLDERFADNSHNWPNNQQGVAWLTGGSYRLATRQPGKFVALGMPLPDLLQDVIVTATFRKVGGPAGGGYGLIVRDQGPAPRDGSNQFGQYYVLEAGDKGEVGIWRRDGDHWIDLVPWQHSDAVRTGTAINELTVRAVGQRLSLIVNGSEVASHIDEALPSGRVGLFVGGDGNQVAVDHLSLQTP